MHEIYFLIAWSIPRGYSYAPEVGDVSLCIFTDVFDYVDQRGIIWNQKCVGKAMEVFLGKHLFKSIFDWRIYSVYFYWTNVIPFSEREPKNQRVYDNA